MGFEIERKFLIKNNDWKKSAQPGQTIKQGYLNLDIERTVRVRVIDRQGIITIKGKTVKTTRLEFEYEIPIKEAEEILKLSDKSIIEKTRYKVIDNGMIWEIDIFEGDNKGLQIAEIELKDENEAIKIPVWVGKEVSEESKYYNSNLINNPFSKWIDKSDWH